MKYLKYVLLWILELAVLACSVLVYLYWKVRHVKPVVPPR
jgi:acyl dehydratase